MKENIYVFKLTSHPNPNIYIYIYIAENGAIALDMLRSSDSHFDII
jgi:hypothetical protein